MAIKSAITMLSRYIGNQSHHEREARLYRDLMRHEARIGGTVFGEIPEGRRREFFCLDKHTWVWHEEWTDKNGQHKVLTTRYDIRPNGILKSQNGNHYQSVTLQEAERLLRAAQLYKQKIDQEIYNFA
jgi:hypothetical protein